MAMEMGAAATTPRMSTAAIPPTHPAQIESQQEDGYKAADQAQEVAEIARTVNY